MIPEVQRLCVAMGDFACYEFSIMAAAEVEKHISIADPISVHILAVQNKFVGEDCFVVAPGKMMTMLCGDGEWIVLKAGDGLDSAGNPYDLPLDYIIKPGEHDVGRWERTVADRPGVQRVIGHFVYRGPGPLFDAYGNSATRTHGRLVSRRIFRRR